MTKEEREKPEVLNGSRKARIAAGAGVSVFQVNQLLKKFNETKKMMKQMMAKQEAMTAGKSGKRVSEKENGKNSAWVFQVWVECLCLI